MLTTENVQSLVTLIGIPSTLGAFIYIGRKLQVLDSLEKVTMEEIRPAITDLQERVSSLEGKIGQIVQSRSPLSMTDKGEKILVDSGLKDYIDTHQNELFVSPALS